MEERIMDDEELRKIKLKRTKEGTDAVDELSPDAEGDEDYEDEVVLELPEGEEFDEDLVGLTPSQLKEELERREKAAQEARKASEELTLTGAEKLARGAFAEAEALYAQALLYNAENDVAREGLWTARTKNFTDDETILRAEVAEELSEDEKARAFVLPKVEERLKAMRDKDALEEAQLRPGVEEKMAERREAFAANRKYWLIRCGLAFAAMALFLIGVAVSASRVLTTLSNTPVILAIVFGACAFVALAVGIFFSRKLFLASQLCRQNEMLSSTEDGARLAVLEERLYALNLVLGD